MPVPKPCAVVPTLKLVPPALAMMGPPLVVKVCPTCSGLTIATCPDVQYPAGFSHVATTKKPLFAKSCAVLAVTAVHMGVTL